MRRAYFRSIKFVPAILLRTFFYAFSNVCLQEHWGAYQEMNPLAILCWTTVSWGEWTIADISHRERKYLAHFDYFVANLCTLWHAFTGLSNVVVCKTDKYQVWTGPQKNLQEILRFVVLVGEGNRVYLEKFFDRMKITRKKFQDIVQFWWKRKKVQQVVFYNCTSCLPTQVVSSRSYFVFVNFGTPPHYVCL